MKKVAIIGGGASSLIIADFLSGTFEVTIYEKEKSIGRKFLVAGKGGFNLTNEVVGKKLTSSYSPLSFLDQSLNNFDSSKTRQWLNSLGIPTFVGSSGRVFPEKDIKPIQVLEAIKLSLQKKHVKILPHHTFIGFDKNKKPRIRHKEQELTIDADFVVFTLGGASWSQTGSDGTWTKLFDQIGIKCISFQPSNCGINVNWSKGFIKYHSGKPLKNISLTVNKTTIKGEALITDYGLEGNAIYPSIPEIRDQLNLENSALLTIDFKPNNSLEQLKSKISTSIKTKEYEKTFNLHKIEFALLKAYTNKDEFCNPEVFVKKIKSLRIPIESLRPIEEAISTIGGVPIKELNQNFSLKKIPNLFVAGEMINWDAPTGGFLLQGCFSTGYSVAQSILRLS